MFRFNWKSVRNPKLYRLFIGQLSIADLAALEMSYLNKRNKTKIVEVENSFIILKLDILKSIILPGLFLLLHIVLNTFSFFFFTVRSFQNSAVCQSESSYFYKRTQDSLFFFIYYLIPVFFFSGSKLDLQT